MLMAIATTLPLSSLSQPSRFPSPPLADRGGSLFVPMFFRLEVTLPSLSSSSVFNPHIGTFSRTWTPRIGAALSAWNGLEEVDQLGDQLDEDAPSSIELLLITSEEQFDRIIAEAQQHQESVVILWMASWCRKCIYLKPKLRKLAADYYPRIRFYCVDVNSVPQKLVSRAGITKMPTIQLWQDSEKKSEIIGEHKAWLVVNEVRRMIDNED